MSTDDFDDDELERLQEHLSDTRDAGPDPGDEGVDELDYTTKYGGFIYEENTYTFGIYLDELDIDEGIKIQKGNSDKFWDVFAHLATGKNLYSAEKEVYDHKFISYHDRASRELEAFTNEQNALPADLAEDAIEMIDEEAGRIGPDLD